MGNIRKAPAVSEEENVVDGMSNFSSVDQLIPVSTDKET